MCETLEEFRGTYSEFEWNEAKREKTLQERGIDFVYVAR